MNPIRTLLDEELASVQREIVELMEVHAQLSDDARTELSERGYQVDYGRLRSAHWLFEKIIRDRSEGPY
jgi:hypothetical protein